MRRYSWHIFKLILDGDTISITDHSGEREGSIVATDELKDLFGQKNKIYIKGLYDNIKGEIVTYSPAKRQSW